MGASVRSVQRPASEGKARVIFELEAQSLEMRSTGSLAVPRTCVDKCGQRAASIPGDRRVGRACGRGISRAQRRGVGRAERRGVGRAERRNLGLSGIDLFHFLDSRRYAFSFLRVVTLQLRHLRVGRLGTSEQEEAGQEKRSSRIFHICISFQSAFSLLDYKSHHLSGEDAIWEKLLRMSFDFGEKGVIVVGIVMCQNQ
jgi:hypothetical protein